MEGGDQIMSKQVDERVVEMRFDNKQFESATKESMSTLDKLKQKLQLKDAAKGLDNLEKAAKKVDLNPLGKSVDTVTAKFSAMQVAGATAIANLTNSAVNAGKNITKALTIEPVTTGFQEYETQIGAIQTILANTQKEGTNVERVNASLDELNTYADQTIYNFTEMTRNIGTFTAAGVKLDDSVSAIKGIANLAAVSGSTSQQASTAMYQLSQALAAGKVTLMDWNSVVTSGMGGQVFQDALIRTSENLKTGAKQAIATYGTFRESLTKSGWLTKEVLTETLGQLAGAYSEADLLAKGYSEEQAKEIVKLAETAKSAATDVKTFTQLWGTLKEAVQSGWGQTWRMIVGDFDEAKERMTKLSKLFGDIIEKSSNRRNSMLSGALDSSWKQLNNKLKNAGIETETFQNKIKELAKTHNVNLDEMIKQEGSFEKALRKAFSTGTLDKSILIDAIKSFTGGIRESAEAAKAAGNQMEKYHEIADKVIRGDFGNGAERIEKLTAAGYEYAAVQNIINERLGSSVRHMSSLTDEQIANADSLATLSDEQLKSNGYTEEQIVALKDLKKEADDAGSSIYKLINGFEKPSGVELAWGSIFNILDSITESCKAVKKAWTEIFHPGMTEDQIIAERSERLYKLLESIHAFTEALKVNEETAKKITRTFKGVFAILDLIRMVVGGALSIGFRVLKEVLSAFDMDVLDLTANIGDAIAQFHDWVAEHNLLAKAIQFIIPYVKQAVSAVSEWIKNNETIQNGINNLRSAFNNATKGLRDWVDNIKEADNIPKYIISGLVNGIKNGASLAVEAIIELGKSILEGIKGVLGIHSPSTKFFEIGSNMIAGLINGLKAAVSALLSFIGDIGHKCIDIISKIDFGKVFTLTISAGIIYSAKKLYELAGKFAAPLEGLGKMFGSLGKMFNSAAKVLDNFSGMIKVKKYEAIAKMFLNLGIAIGIMAASVWILSNIPDDKLWNAVKAVGALAAIFGVLAFAINKISGASASIGKDGVKISGIKTALISLGIALLLLAATVKMLGTLTPDEATHGFIGLAGLVAAIGLVLLAFGKLVKGKSAQNIDKFGVMLIKMSGALLLLMIVVKLIGRLSIGEMGKGTLFLAGFLVFINLFSKIANGKDSKSMKKVSDTLLKISGALLLMVVAVKLIGRLSLGEIVKGTLFLTGFLVFIKALTKVTEIGNDKQIAKISGLLLAISGALILMALACKLIGTLSLGDIGKGVLFVAGFLVFIKYLVKFTTIGDKQQIAKVAATILAMSVAIGILAAVSVLLGLVDLTTLAKGVAAVTILGTIMTAMIWATKGAENVKGNIIAMIVAIGVMAASVALLSTIDPGKLAGATTAMGILMSIFAVMLKVAGKAQAAIGPVIAMSVVVGLLARVLYILSSLPIKSVLGSAAALSVLLLSMSTSLAILSAIGAKAKKALLGVLGLLAMVIPLRAFVGVLTTMQNIKNAMSNAMVLANFATVMTALLVILTGIGILYMASYGVAATGILGLWAMALPLNAFVDVLAKMQGIQNAEANANVLISLMTAMTSLLTQVSILGPLALLGVTAITAMTAVMTVLAGLVVAVGALNETFPQLETFLDSGIDLLSKLANGLGKIIGSFVGGIAQGLTSGLPEVATNLSMFMMNLMPFITGVKLLDESVLTNAQTLVSLIMSFTKAGLVESIASWFGAGDSLNEFALQLVPFGMSMVAFSNTVKGIDESAVTAAANAGKMMAEMAKTIPREGGWWGTIAGEKDMASFGLKLVAFGSAIKSFSAILTTGEPINEAAVKSAANVGEQMTDLANSMPKSGGIWQDIVGEQDLGVFGAKIVAYATSIKTFAVSIKGLKIDENAMSSAINAGKKMTEFAEIIPKSGGWWGAIAGEKDISEFGAKIVAFGKSIKEFSESISSGTTGLDLAVSSIDGLMETLSNITSVNADAIESFKKSLKNLGKISVDGFIDSFKGADARAKAVINTFLNVISNAVTNGKESINKSFKTVGSYLVDGFVKGITDNTFKAEAQARAMADAALIAAKARLGVDSPSKEFMKVGNFVVAGLANGIIKNIGTANKASVKMANGVLQATQDELGIHSPSLVMNEQGHYIVQGIANGIKEESSAEKAAKEKADAIVKAFQNELDKIDLGISNRSKDFDLWQLTDGETASDIVIAEKQRKKLNDDLWDYNQRVKLTTDKYLILKETFGENYKATQEAYSAMRDAQTTAAQTASSLISIDKSIISSQEEHLDNWKTINENDLEIMELESSNGYLVSNAYKDSRYLSTYKDNISIARTKMENAKKAYDEAFSKYGDMNHSVVQKANIAYQEAYKEWLNAQKTYNDYEDSIVDQELQNIEDSRSHREDIIARWEAKNGDDASDRQRYLFYKNMYDTDSIEAWKEYSIYLKSYEDFVADLAENNNLTIEEAKKLKEAVDRYNNEVYPAQTKAIEADKKVSDHRKEYLEQQKEDLKDQYETASDIADLKYQIWEKTGGREATDAEKDTMKLAMLTEQLGQQAKLVEMARKAWKNSKSDEKQKYEKEYLSAQLELANLQSEVLDIQEENIKRQERALDRQRNAQDEYNNYLKKYEQYYLDHGMTLAELEKDAKLVSGYDPDKVVTKVASKTNTAIENIKTNVSNLTKAVGEGIQNGVSEITDNTTSMLKSCADALDSEKVTWAKAGIILAQSLATGIRSRIQDAVNAAVELASKTLAAIQSVFDGDMDYNPTITPVLDMSNVSAGAMRLNRMLANNATFDLAESVSRLTKQKTRLSGANSQSSDLNSSGPTYSFTQINNSPKALSSVEIYRQTNNMISRIGRKVTK